MPQSEEPKSQFVSLHSELIPFRSSSALGIHTELSLWPAQLMQMCGSLMVRWASLLSVRRDQGQILMQIYVPCCPDCESSSGELIAPGINSKAETGKAPKSSSGWFSGAAARQGGCISLQGSLSRDLLSWNYFRNDLKSKSHTTWPNPYLICSSKRKTVFFSGESKEMFLGMCASQQFRGEQTSSRA